MLKRICIYLFLVACILVSHSRLWAAIEPCDIEIKPNVLTVGASYNGGKVIVTGTIPADADPVIEVEGKTAEVTLMKKEHVFGLLWMNSGSITLAGLPSVYMLYMPANITKDIDKMDIGYGHLKKQATITPKEDSNEEKVGEFLKLKKKEGLYAVHKDAMTSQIEGGVKKFMCILKIPPAINHGTYAVKTSVIENGQVKQTVSNQLKVEEVGLPAFIRSLAFDHALLYGILATIIAILAGLLTGVIFKGGDGAH